MSNNHLVSIQEAGRRLGVSTKTLRRWEERGVIIPLRTVGNQRRYSQEQLIEFTKKKYNPYSVISSPREAGPPFSELPQYTYPSLTPNIPKETKPMLDTILGIISSITPAKYAIVACLLLALGIGSVAQGITFPKEIPFARLFPRGSDNNIAIKQSNNDTSAVLAESTLSPNYLFRVRIPSQFDGVATFKDNIILGNKKLEAGTINALELTAGNVLYSVKAGDGISVGTGQNPTITNSGVLSVGGKTGTVTLTAGTGITIDGTKITNSLPESNQNLWKTMKVGSTTVDAGSATDTFTFASGNSGELSLAIDTTNKKLTLTPSTGFTDGGTSIYLTTSTDSVGIGTTSPGSKLEVAGTGWLRGASSTTGLFVNSSGNVGVGTTSPSGALHVIGQCVTGDTILRRRRRRRRSRNKFGMTGGEGGFGPEPDDSSSSMTPPRWNEEGGVHSATSEVSLGADDEYYWEDVRIDQIEAGDEILTLDEESGKFITSKVKALMRMGIHETFEIITETGKSIRTTANHPYLVLNDKENLNFLQKDSFEYTEKNARRFYFENLAGRKVYSPVFKENVHFTEEGWNHFVEKSRSINELITRFFALPRVLAVLKHSPHYTGYKKIEKTDMTIEYWELQEIVEYVLVRVLVCSIDGGQKFFLTCNWLGTKEKEGVKPTKKELSLSPRTETSSAQLGRRRRLVTSQLFNKLTLPENPKNVKWVKVKDIKIGQKIATVNGWERIISLKNITREQVFDIEVENTHNFVGNGIVAHNTYLMSGNVGIGTTSTLAALDIRGNLGTVPTASISASSSFASLVVDNSGVGDIFTASSSGLTRVSITRGGNVSIGGNLLPIASGGGDMGSSALRWNNLYVNSVNSVNQITGSGQATFTYEPTSNAISQGSVWINPTTATAAYPLLSFSIGGIEKARITTDGYLGLNGANDPGSTYIINTGSKFNLSTGGNIGVGTTSPLSTIDIRGTSGTIPVASVSGTSSFAAMVVDNKGVGDIFTASSSGLNRFVIKQDGNVGIGTTGPTALLQVTGSPSGYALDVKNGIGGCGGNVVAIFRNDSSASLDLTKNYANFFGGNLYLHGYDSCTSNGYLGVGTISPVGFVDIKNQGKNVLGKALMILDQYENQDILTASASGTTRLVINNAGNVGIGTTSPIGKLHVEGQCVTGDTLLKRRRRRRGKNGEWIDEWEDVRIDDIQTGDEILTLDEATGKFVPQKIEKLMDMGIQEVFELVTVDGRKIRTTSNHPYLTQVKSQKSKVKSKWLKVSQLKAGMEIAVLPKEPKLSSAVFIDYANVKAWAKRRGHLLNLETLYSLLRENGAQKVSLYYGTDPMNPAAYAFFNKMRAVGFEVITKPVKYQKVSLLELLKKPVNRQMLEKLSKQTRRALLKEAEILEKKNIRLLNPKANFDVEISLDMIAFADKFDRFMLFSGDGDFAATVKALRAEGKKVLVVSSKKFLAEELYRSADKTIYFEQILAACPSLIEKSPDKPGKNCSLMLPQENDFVKSRVSFVKIASIKKVGREKVWDIQVANTHNFVGNEIVAHNTYLSGNVGIGTTSPLAKLHVEGACVALGTRIRRRRRGKNGEWIEEEIPVEDIKPDDEVLSLNDRTGEWEWHKVEKTMDMGMQKVYELITETGKSLETTDEHPYFVLNDGEDKTHTNVFYHQTFESVLETARAFYQEALEGRYIKVKALDSEEIYFSRDGWDHIYTGHISKLEIMSRFFALPKVIPLLKLAKTAIEEPSRIQPGTTFWAIQGIIEGAWVKVIVRETKDKPKHFYSVVWKGEDHSKEVQNAIKKGAVSRLYPRFQACHGEAGLTFSTFNWNKYNRFIEESQEGIEANKKELSLTPSGSQSERSDRRRGLVTPQLFNKLTIPEKRAKVKWMKAKDIKVGAKVATINGWERVIAIKEKGRVQTYDLQIANTHNFVGNGIVAHNTTGKALGIFNETGDQNIFVASASGATKFVIQRDGNVGIGTTGPGYALQVIGSSAAPDGSGATTGSLVVGRGPSSSMGIFMGYLDNNYSWIQTFGGKPLYINPLGNNTILNSTAGNVGIGTTAPLAALDVRGNLGTVPTASISATSSFAAMVVDNKGVGDIFTASSSGLNRFVITQSGNVGVGTTSPLALLHVAGQCVTGDTLLKRRRRRKRSRNKFGMTGGEGGFGPDPEEEKTEDEFVQRSHLAKQGETLGTDEYYWEDVRIDQIEAGDEILTLDEESGKFVTSKVKQLMDMGIHETFEIITESGKSIRTTANHPYLVNLTKEQKQTTNILYFEGFEYVQSLAHEFYSTVLEGQSIKVPSLNNEEVYFSREGWNHLVEEKKSRFETMARFFGLPKIIPVLTLAKQAAFEESRIEEGTSFWVLQGIIEGAWIKVVIRETKDKPKHFYSVIWKGEEHRNEVKNAIKKGAVSRLYPRRQAWETLTFSTFNWNKYNTFIEESQEGSSSFKVAAPNSIRGMTPGRWNGNEDEFVKRSHLASLQGETLKNAKWTKVSQLKIGQKIATVNGWEKIVSIKSQGRKQVFDIEVENTHNFVGNNIVAHNTAIFGAGEGGTPTTTTLRGAGASGTNIAGANFTFDASNGTGTGGSGAIIFRTAPTGATGTTANTLAEIMRITPGGNVGIGTTAPTRILNVVSNGTDTANVEQIFIKNLNNTNAGHSSVILDTTHANAVPSFAFYRAGVAKWDVGVGAGDGTLTSLNFYNRTNSANRMVIQEGGNVGVGTTAPLAALDVRGNLGTVPAASVSANTSFATLIVDNTGAGDLITASTSGTTRFTVANNGNLTVVGSATTCTIGNGTGATNCTSDIRLKDNIVSLDLGIDVSQGLALSTQGETLNRSLSTLDKIMMLNPVSFTWRNNPGLGTKTGLIAQEVQEVFPEFVNELPGGYLGLDYAGLISPAIKAIQEQQWILNQVQDDMFKVRDDTLKLASQGEALRGQVASLSAFAEMSAKRLNLPEGSTLETEASSSTSATLAQGVTFPKETPFASNATIQQLNNRIALLETNLASFSAILGTSTSTSEESWLRKLSLPPSEVSSRSGFLNNLAIEQFSNDSATISGSLMVLGRTTLSDLGVTGNITAGVLSIHGMDENRGASINTLGGALKLQTLAFDNIEMMAGKVTIDTSGNIITKGTITAKEIRTSNLVILGFPSIGTATISAGLTSVDVLTDSVKDSSKIFITPRKPVSIGVTQKVPGNSFKVEIDAIKPTDITFDWWLVETMGL